MCVLYRRAYTLTLFVFIAKHNFVIFHLAAIVQYYSFPFWLRMIADVELDFTVECVISLHQEFRFV